MDNQLQAIKIVAKAIIGGGVLFTVLALLLKKFGVIPFAAEMDPAIVYMAIAIAAGGIAAAFLLYRKRSSYCKAPNEEEKFSPYRAAVILQYALFDGPALFNIISYMLTGNIICIVVVIICLLLMVSQFPNEDRFNRFGE